MVDLSIIVAQQSVMIKKLEQRIYKLEGVKRQSSLEAAKLIKQMLSKGEMRPRDIYSAAKDHDISYAAIRMAKFRLKIKVRKINMKEAYWSLPDCHKQNLPIGVQ